MATVRTCDRCGAVSTADALVQACVLSAPWRDGPAPEHLGSIYKCDLCGPCGAGLADLNDACERANIDALAKQYALCKAFMERKA